jgi:hypothetical protein
MSSAIVHDDNLHSDEAKRRNVPCETRSQPSISHGLTAQVNDDRLVVKGAKVGSAARMPLCRKSSCATGCIAMFWRHTLIWATDSLVFSG